MNRAIPRPDSQHPSLKRDCAFVTPLTFLALVVASVALVVGCETVDRAYDRQIIPASTNALTGEVTPARTTLAAKPAVDTGLDVIRSIPHPYATLGGATLSLIYTGYLGWRNSRNKTTAKAVIAGAEEYKKTLTAVDAKEFTSILAGKQDAAGVRPYVNKLRGKPTHSQLWS